MVKVKNPIDGTQDTSKVLAYFAISFIFIIFTVWFSTWITKKNTVTEINKTPSPTPAAQAYTGVVCPKDFNLYQQEEKQVADLISVPKSMFANNGRFVNSQIIITKNETQDSKIACGYLVIKARTNDGALKSWENLYVNPNNFGGHIDKSSQFGLGDGNDASEYLFSLNDIKYWKTHNRGTLLDADWAALLNVSDTVTFEIAFNTQDRSGVIDRMSIAYKCWDPATGLENDKCKLKVDKASDTETNTLK